MGKKLRRKDLKQPDTFLTSTERFLAWLRENPRTAVLAAVLSTAVLATAMGVRTYREVRAKSYRESVAIAYAKLRNGELAPAAEEFERAAARAPHPLESSVALAFAGNLFAEIGQDEKAEAVFRRLEVASGSPELRQIAAYNLGVLAQRRGNSVDAERFYEEALRLPGAVRGAAWLAHVLRGDSGWREEEIPAGVPSDARRMLEAAATR